MESHLLQMRGLKLYIRERCQCWIMVASFTDAWIETLFEQCAQQLYRSHLLQMRGLKLLYITSICFTLGRIFYRCVD